MMLRHILTILLLFNIPFISVGQTEFWGTARWGGTNDFGVVFKTNNDGTNPQEMYSFTNGADGGDPHGGVIRASNGKLYGTTFDGGAYDYGVLYEIDPATGTFTKKHDFDSINSGSKCMGTLFEASNGKIYGLSSKGGITNNGVFFEYDFVSNVVSKIIDLDGPVNGSDPYSNTLMQASNGKLYGTIPSGGANNNGILFEYDLATSTFTKKFDFLSSVTGGFPGGRLTEVTPGILYGATINGGQTGSGVIFEYNINTNAVVNKFDMDINVYGNSINDGLMLAANGKLYGLAHGGGPGYAGTLFEYDIALDSITKVVDFGTLDTGLLTTWEPYGSPMQASNGKIYGVSAYGSNGGDLFEYDIATDTYIPLFDFFDEIDASGPYHIRLIEIASTPADVWPGDCDYDLIVTNNDFLQLGLAWNETGTPRPGASLNWVAQPSAQWTGSFPSGVNYKHADTNGDGIVNMNDSAAIYQNYGLLHPFRESSNSLTAAGEFYLVSNSNAVAPGQPVTFEIHLSDASAPIDSIYGIVFSLNFNPALVDTTQMILNFAGSNLGTPGVNMITFEKDFYTQGTIDVALTRTDHTNAANVYGVLGTFTITTLSTIGNLSNLIIIPINVSYITTDGNTVSMIPVQDSVVIDPSLSSIQENIHDQIRIFPSPAKDFITITSMDDEIQTIKVFNLAGEEMIIDNVDDIFFTANISNYKNGMYVVNVVTRRSSTFHSMVVSH